MLPLADAMELANQEADLAAGPAAGRTVGGPAIEAEGYLNEPWGGQPQAWGAADRSALAGLGQAAQCAVQYRPEPQGTGNLQVDPEIRLPSPGLDVEIAYFYNSNGVTSRPYGWGRTLNLNLMAQASNSSGTLVTLTRGNGALVSYLQDEGGTFVPQTLGLLNTLEADTSDPDNPLWLEQTPDGRTMAYPLNLYGRPTTVAYVEDAAGNRHSFEYGGGQLLALEDAVGRQVLFAYNEQRLLESITDWAGRVTSFAYDTASLTAKPLLTTVTGPTGCQTVYEYDTEPGSLNAGRLTGITDPNGYRTTYAYYEGGASDGRVSGRTLVGVASWEYSYANWHTHADGPEDGQAIQRRGQDGTVAATAIQEGMRLDFTRNARGQETMRQDALGHITTTGYDSDGYPSHGIDAAGRATSYTRDGFHNVTRIDYWDGTNEQFVFGGSSFDPDGHKRRVQVHVDQLAQRTSYSYNSHGQNTLIADALGRLTTSAYDSDGNLTALVNRLGHTTSYTPDAAGNVLNVQDAVGRLWTNTYDEQNRLLTAADPLGGITTRAYDNNGNLTIAIDAEGHRTSYTYNAFDKPTEVATAAGITTYLYDKEGRQTGTIEPQGQQSTTVYDTAGRAHASVNAVARLTTTSYDTAGRATGYQDEYGFRTTLSYDGLNRVTTVVDARGNLSHTLYDQPVGSDFATVDINALGQRTTSVYDALGRAVETVDVYGFITTTGYDALNRVTTLVDALGAVTTTLYDLVDGLGRDAQAQVNRVGALTLVQTTVFDAVGRAVASIDPLTHVTTTIYDLVQDGQPATAMLDAAANRSTAVYDRLGRGIETIDARGNISTTAYDGVGRVLASTNALGQTTSWIYDQVDAAGHLLEGMEDPLAHTSTTVFDAAGRVLATVRVLDAASGWNAVTTNVYDALDGTHPATAEIDPLGHVTTSVFDKLGQQIATVDARGYYATTGYDPVGRVSYTYDALLHHTTFLYDLSEGGQPASATVDALHRRSTTAYDGNGQVVAQVDYLGNRSTYQYDELGRVTGQQDANGHWTTLLYDAGGRPQGVQDGRGHWTTFQYDERNLLTGVQDPLGHWTTYSWDEAGRLTGRTDARQVTTYTPDALGRTRLIEYHDGSSVSYSWDAAGRLHLVQDASGLTTYTYDDGDRLTGVEYPTGKTLSYTLDAAGNRTRLQDPDGGLTTYAYDATNRVTLIHNPFGELTSITYDELGREQTRAYANGVALRRSYDAVGRDLNLQYTQGATVVASYTTTYDSVGSQLRQQVQESSGIVATYLYDAASQLVQEQRSGSAAYSISYGYDEAGNRTLRNEDGTLTTYTYDAANQLVLEQTGTILTTYLYDGNGNCVLADQMGALTSYAWDGENRLTNVQYPDSTVETYAYAPDGLRQQKQTGAGTTRFVWDGENLLLETDGSGATQAHYTDWPGVWGGLTSRRQGSASQFYASDASANVRLLLSAGGGVDERYGYRAFGTEVSTSTVSQQPHRFGGQVGYYRDAAERTYVRARHYAPPLGRWISKDPLGLSGQDINLHRYAYNDPVEFIDPEGQIPAHVPPAKSAGDRSHCAE